MAEGILKIDFTDKRALVTGASGGLGGAITEALVQTGAVIIALDKSQEGLDNLKTEFPSIRTVCVNLTDWEATRKAVTEVGPIDLLVNNAAQVFSVPILETSREEVDSTLDVNVRAVINLSQVVGSGMIERSKGGAIVNISSVGSLQSIPNHVTYCATKAAVVMLTKGMAREFGPHNIRVNSISPGIMKTGMGIKYEDKFDDFVKASSLPRLTDKDDVAKMVVFLLSEHANSMTGSNVLIDAGYLA